MTAATLLLTATASSGAQEERPVLLLELRGFIDPAAARYVARGLETAQALEASAVVIELDSPGGLKSTTQKVIQEILDSSVPVVVFVTPTGAQAGSISTFIPLAAHVAAMAPGTFIGAMDSSPPVQKSDSLHGTGLCASEVFRSVAESRGRYFTWGQTLLRQRHLASAEEAWSDEAIDLIAQDPERLFRELEGKEVKTVLGNVPLFLRGRPRVQFAWSRLERVLHRLSHPILAYLLLLAGICLLNIELSAPRTLWIGFMGVVILLFALSLLMALGAHWVGLLLILLANLFLIADQKLPTLRLLTAAGLAAFAFGSLKLFPVGHAIGFSLSVELVAAATIGVAVFFLLFVQGRINRKISS